MKPKILAMLLVVILVAAGGWMASFGDKPDSKDAGSVKLAGEVSLSLPEEQKTVQPDKMPPDFFIIKENHEPITLHELEGKYVFINFWNTWCPPCKEEMPDLNKLYLEYGEENVEFIFINIAIQEKSLDDITSFLSANNYSIPVYLDRKGEVARVYGIQGIPTTVILNPEGQVVYARAGQISYQDAKSIINQ